MTENSENLYRSFVFPIDWHIFFPEGFDNFHANQNTLMQGVKHKKLFDLKRFFLRKIFFVTKKQEIFRNFTLPNQTQLFYFWHTLFYFITLFICNLQYDKVLQVTFTAVLTIQQRKQWKSEKKGFFFHLLMMFQISLAKVQHS